MNRLNAVSDMRNLKSFSQPHYQVKNTKNYWIIDQQSKEGKPLQKPHGFQRLRKQSSIGYEFDLKNIILKLTLFIQKIQQTLNKILHQKDIIWYIEYAKTSQSEIEANISNSLNKYKYLLQNLKQQLYEKQKRSNNLQKDEFLKQNIKVSNIVKNFNSSNRTEHIQQKQKFNFDILNYVLQYFEEHMIPQTHWSKKIRDSRRENFNFTNFWKSLNCKAYKQQDDLSASNLKQAIDMIQNKIQNEELDMVSSSNLTNKQKKTILKPISQTLNAILKIEDLKLIQEMSATEKIAYLFDLQSKVFISSEFIESAAFFEDDITTLSKQKYHKVWECVNENELGDEKTLNEQYKLMKRLMVITNASVIRELETNDSSGLWFKKLIFGLSFPRYFLDFGRAKLQNHKFLRNPNIATTKSIWNLPQSGFLKQIKKPFIFDSIKSNIQFYIPRTNSTNIKNLKYRKYQQNMDILTPNQHAIRVRLLNHKQISYRNTNFNQYYDTILIHYHGGGFIALSSCTSQSYTRKWANGLKIPVFSVDYGKPPEYRFPYPVLDCIQAYIFISTEIHKYFNIRPKRIFIAGDSAGGNLACSVTALTMKLDLSIKPQGLLLAYPAVDTRQKFSPSRINSFNDAILYPTLLMLCMKEYLGQNSENQFNPLASPILLTEDYVSDSQTQDKRWPIKWPKTIVIVGKKDPLFDDALRLCEKLGNAGIEFHCELYKNLSHAFLSIDKMITQCNEAIKDSVKFLNMLISGKKIGKQKLL